MGAKPDAAGVMDGRVRYLGTGYKRLPMWSVVEPLAVGLHQAHAKEVGFRTMTTSYPGRG